MKKFLSSIGSKLVLLGAFFVSMWLLFRYIISNKIQKKEIETLSEGLKNIKKDNTKVIEDTLKEIKTTKEKVEKELSNIDNMSSAEKVEYAKKNGY